MTVTLAAAAADRAVTVAGGAPPPAHPPPQPPLRRRPDFVAPVQPQVVERPLLEDGGERLLRRVADDAGVAGHGWNSSMFRWCSSNVSAKAWEPSGLATKKR